MFQRVKALMSDERDVFRVSLTHLVCGEKRMLNMLTYADVCMSCWFGCVQGEADAWRLQPMVLC